MSNSPLVNYTLISPNRTIGRNHAIDTITIHCVVGQLSVESLGSVFAPASRKASSNYGIGKDGRVGMYVEEKDRAWTSSSSANDNRAVTIECASDLTSPYAINDTVYKKLIELCADICKRNNIKELKWKGDKNLIGQVDKQNLTVHRWFANTDCPGDYIYNRLGQIAKDVNAKLGVTSSEKIQNEPFLVRISSPNVCIHKTPGTNDKFTGSGTFTIVDVVKGPGSEKGWGLLKAYADKRDGWINLDLV